MRTITPPKWLMELLRERHADPRGPWVFPTTAGTLRDPDNTRKQLRQVLANSEWKGVHPYAFRHLVATGSTPQALRAGDRGLSRASMTQDVYMARRVAEAVAGAALEVLAPRRSSVGFGVLGLVRRNKPTP